MCWESLLDLFELLVLKPISEQAFQHIYARVSLSSINAEITLAS